MVLELKGVRKIIRRMLPLKTSLHLVDDEWWSGAAEIPLSYLPQPVQKWNAYAIYKENNNRHFCALYPGEGPPDFHQLAAFSNSSGWLPGTASSDLFSLAGAFAISKKLMLSPSTLLLRNIISQDLKIDCF